MSANRGRNSSTSWMRRTTRFAIFIRDDWRCAYCWTGLGIETATLDHLRPSSRGGGHKPSNLVTACLGCNSRRKDQPVRTFLREESKRRNVSNVDLAVAALEGELRARVRRKLDRKVARQLACFERAVRKL